MNICSILVEGGGQLNFSMLKAGLVDKVYAFIAPKLIGGKNALTPVEGDGFGELSQAVELENAEAELIDGDILITANVAK
ncbi:MAG TPA: bifunctional diaminohydroxyphosphoribosylaminopyrimidine deaminase/5-amino-6-(5-phosphoribosylamino)uracil reductase, partial [Anaerovibrio sp.]|nr:bifunctional diaminohydroxyphosphoribosylaminopyrimidine deaminase/5-amino-6-(5-phosphoribosylamino)uracil reductase [Anaerovibrio sp.]